MACLAWRLQFADGDCGRRPQGGLASCSALLWTLLQPAAACFRQLWNPELIRAHDDALIASCCEEIPSTRPGWDFAKCVLDFAVLGRRIADVLPACVIEIKGSMGVSSSSSDVDSSYCSLLSSVAIIW